MTTPASTEGAQDSDSSPRRRRVPTAQRRKARRLIMQALYQWRMADAHPDVIAAEFEAGSHGKVEWEYFHEVFKAIPPVRDELQAHITPFLDREMRSLDPVEWAILMLGCFELAYRVDVPYRVVINEAVELAKGYGATDGHKYINGVLDKLSTQLRSSEIGAR